jgi:hypothetical protein
MKLVVGMLAVVALADHSEDGGLLSGIRTSTEKKVTN